MDMEVCEIGFGGIYYQKHAADRPQRPGIHVRHAARTDPPGLLSEQSAMARRNDWLGDEMLDRMMNVIMGLAEELYVTRDRLQVMERVLESRGALSREELDRFKPDEEQQADILRDRDAFIQAILSRALDKPPANSDPGA